MQNDEVREELGSVVFWKRSDTACAMSICTQFSLSSSGSMRISGCSKIESREAVSSSSISFSPCISFVALFVYCGFDITGSQPQGILRDDDHIVEVFDEIVPDLGRSPITMALLCYADYVDRMQRKNAGLGAQPNNRSCKLEGQFIHGEI
jgi:hypothetical protein